MAMKVSPNPGLPRPIYSSNTSVLAEFDASLTRVLSEYLRKLADRANDSVQSNMNGTVPTGSGLAFPATQIASADANVLDDYEELPWTPSLAFAGSTAGITYGGTRIGLYTKIGRIIIAPWDFTLTNAGAAAAGSAAQILGLPFPAAGVTGTAQIAFASSMVGLTSSISASVSGSQIDLRQWGATGTASLTKAEFSNTSRLIGVGIYFSAT